MENLTRFDTISLGGLIKLLESRPADQEVRFSFMGAFPATVDSYRGYYDHLALGYYFPTRTTVEPPKVSELLADLKAAVGSTFTGWKGGDYVMDLDTPVWVGNPGECWGTTIVGLEDTEIWCVIKTGYRE